VINTGALFGPVFTAALLDAQRRLCEPRWVLEVLAFESGLDPLRENGEGCRGLWQRCPWKIGDKWVAYTETDAGQQLRDAIEFWCGQIKANRYPRPPTRENFYALNLAPARAMRRVLYADPARVAEAPPELRDEVARCTRPERAYKANRGLDAAGKGWIEVADLAAPLDRHARMYAQRIRRELDALAELEAREAVPPSA
jgi:hypothetical protein